MSQTWTLNDGEGREIIGPCTIEEARVRAEEWARDGDWNLDHTSSTLWIDVRIIDSDGDVCDVVTVAFDPPEPPCCREDGHAWKRPHEIVGGLKENPGVFGSGGGVVVHEVCSCGWRKITDTWASRPDTGEQGVTSVRYREEDEES